MAIMVNDGAYR